MSTPAFPITTLGQPLSDGFKLKLDDIKVRSDTQCGLAASLNASNGFLTEIELNWTWSSAQYDVFCDWYRDDIKDGSIEFTISSLYLFASPGEVTCRFTEPYKAKYEPWGHWNVSVKLETRDAAFISESALDTAWTNAEILSIRINSQPQNIYVISGNTISLSVNADEYINDAVTFQTLFGNITKDTEEAPQQSFYRGKTGGYARPQQSRRGNITVTRMPVAWEMEDDAKALFMAWWHYKLTNGADWFWLWIEFRGVYQYCKVRFTESILLTYQDVGWWKISGTIETVEYNYLPLDDCPVLAIPSASELTIVSGPSNAVSAINENVTLSVVVSSDEFSGTVTYQWYENGTLISGATSSSYTFQKSSVGSYMYYVIATNDYGSKTSGTATVMIGYIPTITDQPDSVTVFVGSSYSISITAIDPN